MPADNIESETVSVKSSAPRLVVYVRICGEMEEAVITADTRASSIHEAMLLLIAAYYVADFTSPKVYVNILNIFQQFVVREAYNLSMLHRCSLYSVHVEVTGVNYVTVPVSRHEGTHWLGCLTIACLKCHILCRVGYTRAQQ